MTLEQSPLNYPLSERTQDIRQAGNSPLTGATRWLKRCQLQSCEFDEEIGRQLENERRRQMERATETGTEWVRKKGWVAESTLFCHSRRKTIPSHLSGRVNPARLGSRGGPSDQSSMHRPAETRFLHTCTQNPPPRAQRGNNTNRHKIRLCCVHMQIQHRKQRNNQWKCFSLMNSTIEGSVSNTHTHNRTKCTSHILQMYWSRGQTNYRR